MFSSKLRLEILFTLTLILTMAISACNDSGNQQSQEKGSSPAVSANENGETADSGQKLKDAPDFTLENRKGEPFTLSKHEGKVVVLNVWATWCGPCRKEIPDFIEIQKEMGKDKVLFVGVSVDKEGWEVVRPFAKEYGINYPIMVDDGRVNRKYGPIRSIPTTFIINKKGKVEYVAPGMINKEKLQPILTRIASR